MRYAVEGQVKRYMRFFGVNRTQAKMMLGINARTPEKWYPRKRSENKWGEFA